MRDRIIVAAYALGAFCIVGAIVLYINSGDAVTDSPVQDGPAQRGEAGQGLLIDLSLDELFTEREQAQTSPPARRASAPEAVHPSRSAAGGGGPAPAARSVLAPAPAVCTPSLLGSVIGLLSSLLGGGGGC